MEDPPEVMGLPAGSLEDKDLTLAYQRGEDGAYQAIYDRYSKRVHSVCRRMLGDSQDAQDAAQESFLRVYQALGRFNGRYQLGPWITRIATNVCLDHIRAKSRRPKDVLPLELIDLDGHEETEVDGPDDIVIRRSESRKVRKVLESLPPMHRAAIVLRDFEGLSYQEVAIALGISDCQVKALIHRARQGFKRSWTSIVLGALLPARLLHRVRKFDTPNSRGSHTSSLQHFAETASATAAPAASSCSAALTQCGQFVADKFAPALTAVALGVASLAMPSRTHVDQEAAPAPAAAAQLPSDGAVWVAEGPRGNLHGSVKAQAAVVEPRDAEVEPSAEDIATSAGSVVSGTEEKTEPPSPAPSTVPPSPSPSSSPSNSTPTGDHPASLHPSEGGTSPQPTRTFTPSVAFASTRTPSASAPKWEMASVDCDATRWMKQEMETNVQDGDRFFPTVFDTTVQMYGFQIYFRLRSSTSSHTIAYTGEGRTSGIREAGALRVSLNGSYRTYNRDASDLGLPMEGQLTGEIKLDCSGHSVISQNLTLSRD